MQYFSRQSVKYNFADFPEIASVKAFQNFNILTNFSNMLLASNSCVSMSNGKTTPSDNNGQRLSNWIF